IQLGEVAIAATGVWLAMHASIWLILRLRRPRPGSGALVTAVVVATGWLANEATDTPALALVTATLVVFALSLPFHYFFRRRGYRFVRKPHRMLAAQAEMPSPVSAAQ